MLFEIYPLIPLTVRLPNKTRDSPLSNTGQFVFRIRIFHYILFKSHFTLAHPGSSYSFESSANVKYCEIRHIIRSSHSGNGISSHLVSEPVEELDAGEKAKHK
jgi:hypothetical protein